MFEACQSDADVDEDFSFLQPLDLITKDVYELRQMIKDKKKNLHKDRDKEKHKDKEFEREHERESARVREKDRLEREKESEKDRERVEKEKERDKQHENNADREMVPDQADKNNVKHEENGNSAGEFISMFSIFALLADFLMLA